MENTQGIRILNDIVLTLNFLNADEQVTTLERHEIVKGTAELNQPKNIE